MGCDCTSYSLFCFDCLKILSMAHVEKKTFHDIRKTAITKLSMLISKLFIRGPEGNFNWYQYNITIVQPPIFRMVNSSVNEFNFV